MTPQAAELPADSTQSPSDSAGATLRTPALVAIGGAAAVVAGLLAPFRWGEALAAMGRVDMIDAGSAAVVLALVALAAGVWTLRVRRTRPAAAGSLVGVGLGATWGLVMLVALWVGWDGEGFEASPWSRRGLGCGGPGCSPGLAVRRARPCAGRRSWEREASSP